VNFVGVDIFAVCYNDNDDINCRPEAWLVWMQQLASISAWWRRCRRNAIHTTLTTSNYATSPTDRPPSSDAACTTKAEIDAVSTATGRKTAPLPIMTIKTSSRPIMGLTATSCRRYSTVSANHASNCQINTAVVHGRLDCRVQLEECLIDVCVIPRLHDEAGSTSNVYDS